MDASLNKVMLIGRLGADPELRVTTSGKSVVNLSVATTQSWEADGDRRESTEWTKVVVWGKQAENCNRYLERGRKVYVEGRLRTSKWTDRDGVTRYKTEVVARSVLFLDSAKRSTDPTPEGDHRRVYDEAEFDGDLPF